MTAPSFAASELLRWYASVARPLPWRDTTDPYPIWLSEIMLQQTQVVTVLPRYGQWFAHFPEIAALASASEQQVLSLWQGLGYYRRARLLHAAARRVVDHHGGAFPNQFAQILELPGVGRSTAGAIASFAFGIKKPVLDGNVRRVLARWRGVGGKSEAAFWQEAETLIAQQQHPGSWNQALMELGATLCSPRQPDCKNCPLQKECRLPGLTIETKKPQVIEQHWQVVVHRCPQRGLWLEKRPADGIWGGLWSPPIRQIENPHHPATLTHRLTHRLLHLHADAADTALDADTSPDGVGRWVSEAELANYPLPTGIKKLLLLLPELPEAAGHQPRAIVGF